MSQPLSRLFVGLISLLSPQLADAACFGDWNPLKDLPDGQPGDQIIYKTDEKIYAWIGYDSFMGHITNAVYRDLVLTVDYQYDFEDPSQNDISVTLKDEPEIISDFLTSEIESDYAWRLLIFYGRLYGPLFETGSEIKRWRNSPMICGDTDIETMDATEELSADISFDKATRIFQPDTLPLGHSFTRSPTILKGSYQTNVELRGFGENPHVWDANFWYGGAGCDDDLATRQTYDTWLADYRWARQSAEFRVQDVCPGEYILHYSIGRYKAEYKRVFSYDIYDGRRIHGSISASNFVLLPPPLPKRILIGKDRQMEGQPIVLPQPPPPPDEHFNDGFGYELITTEEQLRENYGIDAKTQPELARKYLPRLERVDCGCGGDQNMIAPGAGTVKNCSVNLNIDLGKLGTGLPAGALSIDSASVSSDLLSPAALKLIEGNAASVETGVRAITSGNLLRQVRTPQAFVDIITLSATSYEIRFYTPDAVGAYDPGNPIATPSGTPYTKWTIAPGASAGSVSFAHGSDLWEFRNMTSGGTEMLRNGISETHETTSANGAVTETRKITDPVYGLVSHTRQTWRIEEGEVKITEDSRLDGNGNILRGLVTDPNGTLTQQVDGRVLATKYESSSYSGTSYTDGSSDSNEHWSTTLQDMDGDAVQERLTTSKSYTSPSDRNSYSHVIAYSAVFEHNGVNYKKEETRQAKNSNSPYWDSPEKRVTTRWIFADGDTEGRTAWEFHPDGSANRWTYGVEANGNTIEVHEVGKHNAGKTAIPYGRRSTTITDTHGRWDSSEERDIATNRVISLEKVLQRHPLHGAPTDIDRNGVLESREYSDCCGRLEKVTSQGLVRTILYDGLGRESGQEIRSVSGAFISGNRKELDALGRPRKTFQRLGNGSERLLSTATYNVAGVLTATWSVGAGTVTHAETVNENGRWVETTTRGDSASGAGDALQEVRISTGNRLPLEFHRNDELVTQWSYSSASEGNQVTQTKVSDNGYGGDSMQETGTTVSNYLGEQLRVEYPFPYGAHDETEYDQGGRVIRRTDADGVQTLFAYQHDATGEHVTVAVDMNKNGVIDYSASGIDADRITKTTTTYGTRENRTVLKTTTAQWIQNGDTPRIVSVEEHALDGSKSWKTALDTQTTTTVITINQMTGLRTETTTFPDNTVAVVTTLGGRRQSDARRDANGSTVSSVSYEYDDWGRIWKVTDARGATTYSYPNDREQTVTTPDPGTGALTTKYQLNDRGALIKVTHPDGKITERLYWPDGSLKRTWGARTYPEYRLYDRQGRIKALTTWQDYDPASHTGTGAATTAWNYHVQRGWLENKRYHDADPNNAKGPSYTYTDAGRLKTRTWARTDEGAPLVTTYNYNDAGDLGSIHYSDDVTPGVQHTYDRAGRPLTTTDAAGLLTRGYDPVSLQLSDESYTGSGFLAGRALGRTYDPRNRPATLSAGSGYSIGYGYDSAGRLAHVDQGFHSAVFGYETGTSAHDRTTIKRVDAERLRNETVYDALGRIDLTRTIVGGQLGVLRDYTLDKAGQRKTALLEDGRMWVYNYDDLGQLRSAQKRVAENFVQLPGYSFTYTFDDIGNRTQTNINGRSTTYVPDLLNRYNNRQVAGAIDVRGEAAINATVTVEGQSATRTGKDFYKALSFGNSAGPVSDTITITATRSGQTVTEDRPVFLPQTPENFDHDDDGNLTGDGRWVYSYDAENRLVGMVTKTSIATAFPSLKQKLEFAYDAQSRRIRKVVSNWNATANGGVGSWVTVADTRFLYDGWNLVCELNALSGSALVRSYVWGLDLSGTRQGAGGVGGLLWANAPTQTFAASSDGNGNIVAWINTASLAVSGRTDYGPFGEVVQQTGVSSQVPFGFSSKYTDTETNLVYYGFRYYNPSTGRWLSRDPIQEKGGLNVYAFVRNRAPNRWDAFGLTELAPGISLRPPSSDIKDFLDAARVNLNSIDTPEGFTELMNAFQAARKLKKWNSDNIDASEYYAELAAYILNLVERRDRDAIIDLGFFLGERVLDDIVEKTALRNIYVIGIKNGASVGSDLGNMIGQAIADIAANAGYNACKCLALDLELNGGAPLGAYQAKRVDGSSIDCYRNRNGVVFAKVIDFQMSDDGFVGDLKNLFKPADYIWYTK